MIKLECCLAKEKPRRNLHLFLPFCTFCIVSCPSYMPRHVPKSGWKSLAKTRAACCFNHHQKVRNHYVRCEMNGSTQQWRLHVEMLSRCWDITFTKMHIFRAVVQRLARIRRFVHSPVIEYRVFLKILTHFFRFLLWCLLHHWHYWGLELIRDHLKFASMVYHHRLSLSL